MTQFSQAAAGGHVVDVLKDWMLKLFGDTPQVRHRFNELNALPREDIERVAHDVGLSTNDLLETSHGNPANIKLMHQMLAQLDIDAASLRAHEPGVYHDMERLCGLCRDTGKCAHDLAKGDAKAHFHEYCLNTATLDALRAEKK